ncbi:MAG: MFS transporter [Spirochaetales bacterium]|nr:MFS transporter [Spirochaetales bacterium]
MNKRQLLGFIIGACVILTVAQFLNAILSISSFEQTFRNTLISRFQIGARELKRQVETSVNYGKPLNLFSGMDSIFKDIKAKDKDIKNLYVTLPDRAVLYSTDPQAAGMQLGTDSFPSYRSSPPPEDLYKTDVTAYKHSIFISLPVYYNDQKLTGMVWLEFDARIITRRIQTVIMENLVYFVPILLGAFLVTIGLLMAISGFRRKKAETAKGGRPSILVSAVIIFVLILAQAGYAYFNNQYFQKTYVGLFDQNIESLSEVIRDDFNYVLGFGIPLKRMKKAEVILGEHLKNAPEARKICLVDTEGNALYSAERLADNELKVHSVMSGMQNEKVPITGTELRRLVPIRPGGGPPIAYLVTYINEELINRQLYDILLDALTIIIVSLITSLELVRLLTLVASGKSSETETEEAVQGRNLKVIRVTAFLFFFAAFIPLSFLPPYIEQVLKIHPVSLFNLSAETMISLPISAYLAGITIAVLIVGFLSRIVTIRSIYVASCILYILGSLFTAFSPDIYYLIIVRFVAGLGYGGIMMNSTALILRSTSDKNRSTGFGSWVAGCATATISAIAIGGVIVNRLGFTVAIVLSAVFAFILLLFIFFYVRPEKRTAPLQPVARFRFRDIFILFRNKTLVANLLFSSIPFSLAYIGLFQYIFPLYMNGEGISRSDIGRILTVYGLISLLTPLISRIADKYKNEKYLIITGNLITGIALVCFMFFNNIYTLVGVILCMGFGGMMIDATDESFITSSREARVIGEARFLSLYTTYDKVISIFVPLLAGILISTLGYISSIGVIGMFTVIGVLLFAVFSKNLRKPAGETKME